MGATWYYNQVDFHLPGERYSRFEVIGSTIIQGKECMIVTGICGCAVEIGSYIYEEDDRIFVYDFMHEDFILLYDFNLVAGDTLIYYSPAFGETFFVIDSVTTTMIVDQEVRVQHIRQDGESLFYFGEVIFEFLGSALCMYPQHAACDPWTGGIRCYEDEYFGQINFHPMQRPCDYITSRTDDAHDAMFVAYPNPAYGYIRFESDQKIARVELLSVQTGNIVLRVDSPGMRIETSDLPPGVYIIRGILSKGEMYISRIVLH